MNHRWIARGLVVALHAALLAALWMHRPPSPAPHEHRVVTTVRLILPQRPAPPPRDSARAPAPPRAAAPPGEPLPIAIDATTPGPATPAPPTPPAAAAPTEPPRTTLRLTLPPGYAASAVARRNPALDDPRSNTPRPTLEDRIADATGGAGAWVEEQASENRLQSVGALGEYRTVMRRGNTCVEIFRSRIADSDPFNSSVAPRAPAKMVGKTYQCK